MQRLDEYEKEGSMRIRKKAASEREIRKGLVSSTNLNVLSKM